MEYSISRDISQELGQVYHVYMGAAKAAMAGAAQANAARAEYELQLKKIMTDLGIPMEKAPYVKVQFNTGAVVVDETIGAPTA